MAVVWKLTALIDSASCLTLHRYFRAGVFKGNWHISQIVSMMLNVKFDYELFSAIYGALAETCDLCAFRARAT